ncbi:hypothetical protein ABFX02_10G038400 [Erythranthe guttata]
MKIIQIMLCAIVLQAIVVLGLPKEEITTVQKMIIGRLPKGIFHPPSGPSEYPNVPPPPEPYYSRQISADLNKMIIGRLPKGIFHPPSGPSQYPPEVPPPPPPY